MTTTEMTKNQELKTEKPLFMPAGNIIEKDNSAVITLDMPGVNAEGLEITVDNDILVIEGKTSAQTPENFKPVYSEFKYGNFQRKFKIPKPVDAEHAVAEMKNGRLKLTIPYAKDAVKKITVKSV